jgi:predicted Zn-dependent protease
VRLQRVAVLLVAIPALAWLGVSYNNARLLQHGRVVLQNPRASHAQVEAALADARHVSSTFEPKRTEALSYQAALEIRAGRLDAARKLFEQVVRLEPDTPEVWLVLSELTRKSDPARSAQALAQLRRLDPRGAGP